MPQVGIRFGHEELTWEQARERAESDDSFPFPPPLVEAMADQRNDETPSASVLTGCMRAFELKRTNDYFSNGTGELPPIFGIAFHSLMDSYRQKILRPGDVAETRMATTLEVALNDTGTATRIIEVAGRVDFFRPATVVSDWKSKLYIPQGFVPPRNHKGQVNIYNWLAFMNGMEPAPKWELIYITQSWVQRETGPTADVDSIGEYVRRKLTRWARAQHEGRLPPPVPQLFEEAKGKAVAPCSYCPVREQCLAALKSEEERPF